MMTDLYALDQVRILDAPSFDQIALPYINSKSFDVAPVSSPIRTTCGARNLMNVAIASGSDATTPSRSIFPVRSMMQIAAAQRHV
jgi:hypothetical protein